MPPDSGKKDGTPNVDASHSSVGCPSYSFVAVTTPFDLEIISNTSALLISSINSTDFPIYFCFKLFIDGPFPIIFKVNLGLSNVIYITALNTHTYKFFYQFWI